MTFPCDYYNSKTRQINAERIASDIRKAAVDFENGKTIEVRNNLLDIVIAIDRFVDSIPYKKKEKAQ